MRRAGYSKATTRSGEQYRSLRKLTQGLDFLNPERINADIEENYRQATQIPELKERVTARARIDEHRAKLAGMITDKLENKGEVQKVIVVYNKINDSIKQENITI